MLTIKILGSAAGGGFPQWNCSCANCSRVRLGDPALRPRTQSSIAISADGEGWWIVNASPDLRQQILSEPALAPQRPPRHSPIVGVVLTNADIDHIAGLLSLREAQPFVLHATEQVQSILARNSVFDVLAHGVVDRHPMALLEPTVLRAPERPPVAPTVTLFPVPGKVALYLEGTTGGDLSGRPGETVGAEITDGERRCLYIPGCAAMTPELASRLEGADLVLFDGTLWTDAEMIEQGVGVKSGRRMGHMSVSGPDGTIEAFRGLRVARKVFVHINNTNPILAEDSPERRLIEEEGWDVAYDGMEIRL